MKNWQKLTVSVIACELVGILGSLVTFPAISSWYVTLQKPSFAPPNWLFAPVWTLLYLLMGVSFYLIWKMGLNKKKVKAAAKYFIAQITLNFLWSPVFFGLRSPLVGLIVIILMWIMILLTMKKFYPLSKLSFYLLLPYILWVSFATLLNAAIVVLN